MTSNLDDDDTTPPSASPSCNHNHTKKQYCILFYKYHPLTDQPHILETYRQATETLCTSLNLTGRILIGLSNNGEGVNGTLAGSKHDLDAYVHCMLGKEDNNMDDTASLSNNDDDDDDDDGIDERIRRRGIIAEFRSKSKQFFNRLNLPELFLASPNDFKWSSSSSDKDDTTTTNNESWFPDLNVKITKEIISTGGAFADISTKDTSVGYLTPKEWHEEIQSLITNKHNNNNSKKKKEEGGNDTTETSSSSSKDEKDDEEQVETILIDVRNHKECQIGSFAPGISIDPQTKTFAQFPQWVKNNVHVSSASSSSTNQAAAAAAAAKSVTATTTPPPSLLNNKRILMYCTGGIRCEKASAYIRQIVPENKGIYHLKGGIHKYLEEFGPDSLLSSNSNTNNNNNSCTSNTEENDKDKKEKGSGDDQQCLFVGKNFVFDRRGALDTKGHGIEKKAADGITTKAEDGGCGIIGKCQYCNGPYDTFRPENICTVCREPVLVCDNCQLELRQEQKCLRGLADDDDDDDAEQQGRDKYRAELHCEDHAHLKACYFTSLVGFDEKELEKQLKELQLHHKELEPLRKKGKQKRRTIRKQMDKLQTVMERGGLDSDQVDGVQCRHCGSATCASDCWGFHGGNTRMMNKNKKTSSDEAAKEVSEEDIKKHKQRTRAPSNQRPAKRMKREKDLSEIETLKLSSPPSQHRNDATGLRVPPPVVRVLRSGIKGKWCGQTVHWVMNNIFAEGSHGLSQQDKDARLEQLIAGGLIRINGDATSSSATVLQNMDTIERIVHWHEPPVSVPSKISLTKHTLPKSILASSEEPGLLYCIDKPSTVPIYPAGPYYSNSLLMMVEAQEGLPHKSLIPLHRIDRATSGVLLCTNTSSVARIVQGRMTSNSKADDVSSPVKKLYLARVEGKFPSTSSESPTIPEECASCASFSWHGGESNIIEVNAPIAVQLESESKSSGKQEDRDTSNAMMHRTVRSDGGKDSTSRFKLVSYDPSTNQSLVACCPITGRGHQLRVHLQLIGFPIHNDVEYGGTIVNEEKRNEQENAAAQSMLDVAAATKDCLHEDSVSSDEVKSAVKLCKCCNSGLVGVRESLNSAQLLGCGHEIDLHAHKYRMTFEQKDGSRFNDKEQMQSETSMEFATDLPSWAASFGTDSSSLTWLN